jgi:hypothetical protein
MNLKHPYPYKKLRQLLRLKKREPQIIEGRGFEKCCAEFIREFYVKHGTQIWCNTSCPKCNHYIGLSPSNKEYIDNFMKEWNLEPLNSEGKQGSMGNI